MGLIMDWRPIGNKVIVKKIQDEDEVTSSGLLLVSGEEDHKKHKKGEVVAVGKGAVSPDGSRIPMSVAVGDIVLYPGSYGTDIGIFATSHSNEHLILHEDDITAIVT
jgi:chaperonin GroES